MYFAGVSRELLRRGSVRRVAASNVLALGMVSLFTDISSEMVTSVLPAFLVLGLHLSVAQYGAVDGLYTGATALTRVAGGYLADRFQQRKLIAGIGYGLSAAARAGMVAVTAAPAALGAVLAVDRAGKGIRTAPRDALITLSVPSSQLGRAFGLHRALDSLGAFLGPLAALGILALAGSSRSYSAVFVGSLCAALIGLLVLVLFVKNRTGGVDPVAPRAGQLKDLFRRGPFGRVVLVAALLGLSTVGDGFVYLLLQQQGNLPVLAFPGLAIGSSLSFLVLAFPFGAAADRWGRKYVLIGGFGCLIAVYLLLSNGSAPIVLVLVLYGAFYAATDGVLPAIAGPLIPKAMRTTGIAVLQTGQALAYLVSSLVFGICWQQLGFRTACLLAAGATAAALLLAGLLLRRATPSAAVPA